jgi:cytosine deaminase
MGVDVVGGIPHFERTMADGAARSPSSARSPPKRGLPVDMHCDETDDPLSRHIEQLAYETQRLGPAGPRGRLAPDLHAFDGQLLCLEALAADRGGRRRSAIPNPLINIMLQGRHDTYPKRRGMTRVPEMQRHGIRVGWGQDCVLDPVVFARHGRHARRRLHGLARGADVVARRHARCFDMVTNVNAANHGAGSSRA